ncbi:unnamed protein product [Closterium sp. Naga37s-1]|nr:unnamed protein product [Closterium sp. Naga37s-1]
MTAASNTSPRALRAAQRGEESRPHEQRRGELGGREGIATPEELAEDQEAGGDAAAAAAAAGNAATMTELEAAVMVEAVVAAGPEGLAAEATGAEVAAESDGPDAAFGGGSASPSAIPQAWQPEEPAPAVAQEQTEEVELAVSPEPVTASVLAAAVTAAAGEQDGALAEEDAQTAAASAGTSAAAEGASKQGHGRGGERKTGVTRAQGITWGPPRVGQATPMLAPWIPAGIPQQTGRGEQNAGTRGGATARGTRGGGRGARGGRGGRGPIVGGRVALVRTGTWRERHDRPEQAEPATNQNEDDEANIEEGEEYIAESAEPSEEISLEDEEDVRVARRAGERRRNQSSGLNPQADNPQGTRIRNEEVNGERGNPRVVGENGDAPNEGQSDSGVRSPSDLADDTVIWELAATWEKYPLQKGDQPFVVRRMPPKILESYTLCLLAPLISLSKYPDCPGAWAILQYLPRLTLRPAPEPVEGSRWTAIELRPHQFQLGIWQPLYTDACVIPDNESPIRHQPDDAGLCARAEGLIRKGNISKAVAALRTTPLAEATAVTLQHYVA